MRYFACFPLPYHDRFTLQAPLWFMSQSVNISACPFHRSVHKYGPLCYGPTWPPSTSPCFSCSKAPHLHLFMEKVTLATWPAIWRGPGGYPKQAKHNPITPQGDTPHLLNSAWVIFCFSLGACKDPLTCLRSARNWNQQMFYEVQTPAALDSWIQF